jgi:hypothetical protein
VEILMDRIPSAGILPPDTSNLPLSSAGMVGRDASNVPLNAAGMTGRDASNLPLDGEPSCSFVFSTGDDTTNSAQNSCHTTRQVDKNNQICFSLLFNKSSNAKILTISRMTDDVLTYTVSSRVGDPD